MWYVVVKIDADGDEEIVAGDFGRIAEANKAADEFQSDDPVNKYEAREKSTDEE
jgi:hypothetical protein